MPKRKNPFGEITPLQRKTHVGFEQMATQQEREEVYKKTKALLFQGANPTMDTDKVLGLAAVQIPQLDRQTNGHEATNGPSCTSQQGQLMFTSDGALSAFPRTNGITSVAAGNGSSGSRASGGGRHMGLLSYFTSPQGTARAAQERVQSPAGLGGRQVCCGCRQCVMVGMQLCDHCEKCVCGDCCRQCCVCQSLFCNFCTVLNYDEATERIFCLNCLPISS